MCLSKQLVPRMHVMGCTLVHRVGVIDARNGQSLVHPVCGMSGHVLAERRPTIQARIGMATPNISITCCYVTYGKGSAVKTCTLRKSTLS